MYRVDVINREGKVIKSHFFSRKSKAERYIEESETRNPMGWSMDFKIEKVV